MPKKKTHAKKNVKTKTVKPKATKTHAVHKAAAQHKVNPVNLGLALGIVCATYMFLLGAAAAISGWGSAMVHMLSSLYIGYNATFGGMIIGAIWAFVDCFIAGYLFAWVYNKL